MRSRRVVAVLVTVASVLTGTATTADAAANRLVASWRMDEPAGARTMIDSGGRGLRGTIGREVDTGVRGKGATGYRFERLPPDTPPTRPQHLVTVPDSTALDPGDRDYAVTLRLRTTHKFGNIIQKGQSKAYGGNFKLQIPNGIVQCLFRGSRGSMMVSAPRRINDGAWHTVRCERSRSALALSIDGSTVTRKSGWTGTIANSWPVTIGGKTDCDQIEVGCDYYAGDLDWVEITAS
jgi:Laminin G domain